MYCANYVLDAAGNPVPEPDILAWARWFESRQERTDWIVEKTKVDEVEVSTVFLATDHNLLGSGPPCCGRRWFSEGRWTARCAAMRLVRRPWPATRRWSGG